MWAELHLSCAVRRVIKSKQEKVSQQWLKTVHKFLTNAWQGRQIAETWNSLILLWATLYLHGGITTVLYHFLSRYGCRRARPSRNGTAQAIGIFFTAALGVPSAVTEQRLRAGGVMQGEELMNDLCNSVIKSSPPKNDRWGKSLFRTCVLPEGYNRAVR